MEVIERKLKGERIRGRVMKRREKGGRGIGGGDKKEAEEQGI